MITNLEEFAKENKKKSEDFSLRCKQAMLGIYMIRRQLEKYNIFTTNDYSVTYMPKTGCFHFYMEKINFSIAFTVHEDTIVFKKFNEKYQEGKDSTILRYSDEARGNSEWFTDEYFDWIDIHKEVMNRHPMYYYSQNFNAVEYCKSHNINLILE